MLKVDEEKKRILEINELIFHIDNQEKLMVHHKALGKGKIDSIVNLIEPYIKVRFENEILLFNLKIAIDDFSENEILRKTIAFSKKPFKQNRKSDFKKKFELCQGKSICYFEKTYYLGNYLSGMGDNYSHLIIDFKNNRLDASDKICKLLSNTIGEEFHSVDLIIRALGHDEVQCENNPLDKIGVFLETKINAEYNRKALKKKCQNPKLTYLNKISRKEIMKGIYKFDMPENFANVKDEVHILIVDDVITTGTTLIEISKTIKKAYPKAKLFGLCLAQTNDLDGDVRNKKLMKFIEREK